MATESTVAEIATDFETRAKLIRQKQAERKQLADQMMEEGFGTLNKMITQATELAGLDTDVLPEGIKQEMSKLAKSLESVQTTVMQIYQRRNQPAVAAE